MFETKHENNIVDLKAQLELHHFPIENGQSSKLKTGATLGTRQLGHGTATGEYAKLIADIGFKFDIGNCAHRI